MKSLNLNLHFRLLSVPYNRYHPRQSSFTRNLEEPFFEETISDEILRSVQFSFIVISHEV